jgi:hypothetical protein
MSAPVVDDHLFPAPASVPADDNCQHGDAVKQGVKLALTSVKYDALGPLVVNSDGVSDPLLVTIMRPIEQMIGSSSHKS